VPSHRISDTRLPDIHRHCPELLRAGRGSTVRERRQPGLRRPGWALSISNTDAGTEFLWTFGALGSGLFVISYEEDSSTYRVFDDDGDDDVTFDTIDELREWLDANEARHSNDVRTNLRDMVSADDCGS
jgi:hypothetical protein